ncbi:VanZ family protein [Bacillus sp. B1-b2]|uniref:VanZ family protein n=1 Tax=Bacillus sp. B1-b2 TaxID=2653201 RepID=UPI001261FD8A|nr:VanZ family protein [Bacillus sp. B1-b2]KAB7673187.1 VanZ family protein [Bacillus sp. B1-b2]
MIKISNKILSILFFCFYIVLLFYLLFFSNYRQNVHGVLAYNFIPILSIVKEMQHLFPLHVSALTGNLLGNIFAFIPFGLFITYWVKQPSLTLVLFSSVLLSIAIELLQLVFYIGVCDINDVILNGIGGGIGYFIMKVFRSLLLNR